MRLTPNHTYDFSKHTPIKELRGKDVAAIYGKIVYVDSNKSGVRFTIEDEFGDTIDIMFFNQKWLSRKFKYGDWVTIGGKVKQNGPFTNLNPLIIEHGKTEKMFTQYPKFKGIADKTLQKYIHLAEQESIHEMLDRTIRRKFQLVDARTLYQCIHHPKSQEDVNKARRRLLFEELFLFNLKLFADRKKDIKSTVPRMRNFDKTKALKGNLPFTLTTDQRKTLKEICESLNSSQRLNALVQGDVGSGKTIVALFSLLMNAENGHQGCLMAPTSVLAYQHYEEAKELFEPLGITVEYLSGNLKAKDKKERKEKIKSGEIDVIIGTHAVITDDVSYKDLTMVVVDEEHRFGVEQREALAEKGNEGLHKLSMTATPIPRTLANTLYGEDVSVYQIKTMPNGRKPVKTGRINDSMDAYKLIEKEVNKGHQAYIVCPLIDDNEDINATSVDYTYKNVSYFFKNKNINVGMVNGNMKQAEIDAEIERFANGEIDILVSTTIIEVGVNVPNATVMVIESADRFGLSQLHQLRGRVGRSSLPSACLLVAKDTTKEADYKLNVMTKTTDGFVISKEDMKLRGTGNIVGLEQTGANKTIEKMIKYPKFNDYIKEEVKSVLDNPMKLEQYIYYLKQKESK